jgi:Limonene-1,2-epoxide hydrolase catalytic domain
MRARSSGCTRSRTLWPTGGSPRARAPSRSDAGDVSYRPNDRTDYVTGKDGKPNAFRVGGVFYVRDGKIIEWIDSVVNA